ncbi:spinster family MFS transporter [Singulisphaera sp. PoT]|uniref:spinster family MFS transporter n=1 Tax=Singulisphaera sp. PoT TaxID=3411797 RepID=UPI003BF5ED27
MLPSMGGSYFALAVLFSMNLLNYVDRYSFYAVATHIKEALKIQDTRLGFLSSSFMIVYTIVTPFVGWFGDRYSRRWMLAFGVGLWSLATVGTAFSNTFEQMFFWRSLLGIGEATYGVIAPALLADLFPPRVRGRVMGVYFLALPLGGALGYGIGGWVAGNFHWRTAFLVVGLPGLLVAFAGLLMRDPGRGASEGHAPEVPQRRGLGDYLALFRSRTFLYNTAGMAAVTYASGGYAVWGSTFYQTVRHMSVEKAGLTIGVLTAVAGLVGITLGTTLADFLLRFTKRAYLLMASWAVLAAMPFGVMGMLEPRVSVSLGILFVAMVLLAMVLGPANAITANVVPPHRRAAGYAVNIFLIHLFGDISSPIVIGYLSDLFGKTVITQSPIGALVRSIGAGPVGDNNLTVGMLSVVPILFLGFIFFAIASRHLPKDQLPATDANPIAGPAH